MPDENSQKYLQDLQREIARTTALKSEVDQLKRDSETLPADQSAEKKAQLAEKEKNLQQSQDSVNEKTRIAIEQGHLDVSTPKDGAVFYDNGRSAVVDPTKSPEEQRTRQHRFEGGEAFGLPVRNNGDRARSFCAEPGNEHCRTIEMTDGGKWMDKQNLYGALDSKQADQRWAQLSGEFAGQAKGEAHSFVRTDSAEHRTWASVEHQDLRDNPDVPRIVHHNEQNGIEITRYENLPRSQQEQQGPHTRDLGNRPGSDQPIDKPISPYNRAMALSEDAKRQAALAGASVKNVNAGKPLVAENAGIPTTPPMTPGYQPKYGESVTKVEPDEQNTVKSAGVNTRDLGERPSRISGEPKPDGHTHSPEQKQNASPALAVQKSEEPDPPGKRSPSSGGSLTSDDRARMKDDMVEKSQPGRTESKEKER